MSTATIQEKQKNLAPKQLTESEMSELFNLTQIARKARGEYYPKEVEEASRDLSKKLFDYLNEGVRYKTLAEATGLHWRSIKSRLFRHGYVHPVPPSQQGKVFQGAKEPGPKCDHDKSRFRERINKKTGKVSHIECLDCRIEKRHHKATENSKIS